MQNMTRLCLCALMLLSGCESATTVSASEYAGKWESADKTTHFEVTANGDDFLIAVHGKTMFAVVKDGTLQIPGTLGTGLTYVKTKDTLVGDDIEYHRVK